MVTASANATCYLQTMVAYDMNSLDQAIVPYVHFVARTIGLMLTSGEYVDFAKQYSCNAKIICQGFNLMNRVMAAHAKTLQEESSIDAAKVSNGNSRRKSISTKHIRSAETALVKGIESFSQFCENAEVCEATAVC